MMGKPDSRHNVFAAIGGFKASGYRCFLYRRPEDSAPDAEIPANAKTGVGTRLPAKAVGLCHGFRLIQRVRQQAGSYGSVSCLDISADVTNVGVLPWDLGQRKTRCRSALAREGGGSVPWISVDTPRSPASRLLRVRVMR
jgi:hypothetical protein